MLAGVGSELSMAARAEITAKYARAYRGTFKRDEGLLLDEVMAVMGWSRDHARRRLAGAARPRAAGPRWRQRSRKYSPDSVTVLHRVWAVSGGSCGKCIAAAMTALPDALERHHELVPGAGHYSLSVRVELEAMSAATIDRYLAPARARDPLRGRSLTRGTGLLCSSITVRRAGDEAETVPGFFEGDTVGHCGPTAWGEFARTLNLTDVDCGWCSPGRCARTRTSTSSPAWTRPSTRSPTRSPGWTLTTGRSS